MDLSAKPFQIGPVVGPDAVQQLDETQRNILYKERQNLRSQLNLQDELNEQFYSSYVEKEPEFDYDVAKVTPEQWGKMTAQEKTITRLNAVQQWAEGNTVTQEFFNSYAREFEGVTADITQDVSLVDAVYNDLALVEGESGDTTGAADTSKRGLTRKLYNKIKKETFSAITEEEASKYYLNKLNDRWEQVDGWDNASTDLKKVLLDASYNQGENIFTYKGLKKALKDKDSPDKVMKHLLDASNINKKSSKGLARRYAELYNRVSDSKITHVEQKAKGKIVYWKGADAFFTYTATKGKHKSSKIGKLNV